MAREEFTSPQQSRRLFRHEAGELGVEYLLAVGKLWRLHGLLTVARRHFPELDDALSGRLASKLDQMLSRIPRRYRNPTKLRNALRELEVAWEADEDATFLSTLRTLRAREAENESRRPQPHPSASLDLDLDRELVN